MTSEEKSKKEQEPINPDKTTDEERKTLWKDAVDRFKKGEISESQLVSELIIISTKDVVSERLPDFGYSIIDKKPTTIRPTYLSIKDYAEYRRFQIKLSIASNEVARSRKALAAETWRIAEAHGYDKLEEPQITISGRIVPSSVSSMNMRGEETNIETDDFPKITDAERSRIRSMLSDLRDSAGSFDDVTLNLNDWLYTMSDEAHYGYMGEFPVRVTEERQIVYDPPKKQR